MITDQIKRLNRIWSPDRKIEQAVADLAPGSEIDSVVRDYFTRMVRSYGRPIVLDLSEPNTGNVHWEITVNQDSKPMVTIWHTED